MSKYCPVCFGEFKDTVSMCLKDQTSLVNEKPQSFARLIDIYTVSDDMEAERIINLLKENGIMAKVSSQGISQVPVVSDNRSIISVLKEDKKSASAIILSARSDGLISKNGTFFE